MENKELKNNKAEELNDEALDEVTGGTYQRQYYELDDSKLEHGLSKSKDFKAPGGVVTVPTQPVGDYRKF